MRRSELATLERIQTVLLSPRATHEQARQLALVVVADLILDARARRLGALLAMPTGTAAGDDDGEGVAGG